MLRLFVALELPPPVRDELLGAMGGVAGARWQGDDQLHLTLRFIGEVDRHRARDIEAALAAVNFQALTLSLGRIGSFDRRGRIDTLWVGVTPQAEVAALARRIDAALVRHAGLAAETRAFVPHITVARFGRDCGSLAGFPARPLSTSAFTVPGFGLWESRLTPEGSAYEILARYPVTTAGGDRS
jgi:RNA 2',3'-cyclic 3'-phosphodiesterase